MARAAESIDPRRFSVEEYHRMAETGIFKPDERVELIRGVVRRMSPKNYAHVVAATKLHQRLVTTFPSIGFSISSIGSSWSFALPKKATIENVPPTAPGTVSLPRRGQTS